MSLRVYRYFQSILLIALGAFLVTKIASGKLIWYIHPRFIPLTVLAVVALLLIGLTIFREGLQTERNESPERMQENPDHDHEHGPSAWRLAIVTVPLMIGVLIPAHPLTASAISGKGISSAVPITTSGMTTIKFDQASDTRNILEWNDLFSSNADPSTYLDQNANVIGFVFHDPHLQDGQFLVGRFALVCCPADAFAVVMVVSWPQSASLPTNQWVKVKGPVQSTQFNGQTLPSIQAASVELEDPPAQTYLYP